MKKNPPPMILKNMKRYKVLWIDDLFNKDFDRYLDLEVNGSDLMASIRNLIGICTEWLMAQI